MTSKKYSTGLAPNGLGRVLLLAACILSAPIRTWSDDRTSVLRIGVARAGGGYSVTTVPLEAYVARVLTGEALPDSQPAALEALAITIRTYALANRARHAADGFDLCDETHCQVMRTATPATERAAAATAGLVLLNGGAPASVYYSASCGGRTEVPSAVWPGAPDPPFLPTQRDDACGGAPMWAAELAGSDLLRSFLAAGFRGSRLADVRILERNASGRVARLRLDGLQPDEISGQDLRAVVGRTLGWQHIRSTAFDLKRTAGGYRFSGHGSGHGVGLCVIGSARLAESGRSAEAILHRYFPGLPIGPLGNQTARLDARRTLEAPAEPDAGARPASRRGSTFPGERDILITLPAGDEGEREAMTALAFRARDDLARTLGVSASAVSLRFHATVDSYERATTQPWFTAGAVVGREIHLLPPLALRDRGILERTVRHELVRLMTDPVLGDRPAWVREGAAAYFADTGAGGRRASERPPLAQASCPNDSDLLRPASIGVLTDASARARACFERQLGGGRSWRDVR